MNRIEWISLFAFTAILSITAVIVLLYKTYKRGKVLYAANRLRRLVIEVIISAMISILLIGGLLRLL